MAYTPPVNNPVNNPAPAPLVPTGNPLTEASGATTPYVEGTYGSQGFPSDQPFRTTPFVAAQAFDSKAPYAPGDVVSSNGVNYVNVLGGTGQTPPNGAYWKAQAHDAPTVKTSIPDIVEWIEYVTRLGASLTGADTLVLIAALKAHGGTPTPRKPVAEVVVVRPLIVPPPSAPAHVAAEPIAVVRPGTRSELDQSFRGPVTGDQSFRESATSRNATTPNAVVVEKPNA